MCRGIEYLFYLNLKDYMLNNDTRYFLYSLNFLNIIHICQSNNSNYYFIKPKIHNLS